LLKRHRGRADDTLPADVAGAEQKLIEDLSSDRVPLNAGGCDIDVTQFDDSAWIYLKKHVPAYSLYDKLGLIDVTT